MGQILHAEWRVNVGSSEIQKTSCSRDADSIE